MILLLSPTNAWLLNPLVHGQHAIQRPQSMRGWIETVLARHCEFVITLLLNHDPRHDFHALKQACNDHIIKLLVSPVSHCRIPEMITKPEEFQPHFLATAFLSQIPMTQLPGPLYYGTGFWMFVAFCKSCHYDLRII